MANDLDQGLPEYDNPPVIEVVCNLNFRRIDSLLAPHFGLLWTRYQPEYPNIQEAPPLDAVVEPFGGQDSVSEIEIGLQITNVPRLPRIWFLREDGRGLIQIQRDRFTHNWRKSSEQDEYPRYPHVIGSYREKFSIFESFLQEGGIDKPQLSQCEMTYVNLIPQGEGWQTFKDMRRVFPDFAWRHDHSLLTSISGFVWRTVFPLPNQMGKLLATIKLAARNPDNLPVIIFELTARGGFDGMATDTVWKWFDVAREAIVRGFTELTGAEVQNEVWRRRK